MAMFVIKNLPAELHRRLKAVAEKNNRTISGEAVYLLETFLAWMASSATMTGFPEPYVGPRPLTDKMIRRWKRKGMD